MLLGMPHKRVLTHEVRKVKTGGSKVDKICISSVLFDVLPLPYTVEKFYTDLSLQDGIRFLWVLFD